MRSLNVVFVSFLLTSAITTTSWSGDSADLVLRNGRIVTVDDRAGTVQALAIKGDRILALGEESAIARYIDDDTVVIDLEGRMAMPGFIEGHGHFVGLGLARMNLDLMHARNWNEVIDLVAKAVDGAEPGAWITGRGWHQSKWDRPPEDNVDGFPTHDRLSAVSPDNPVLLTHASGHANFANQNAMELAGISATTISPPGGEIVRDESGEPIGVFRERAQGLVSIAMAAVEQTREQQEEKLLRAIELASQECLSKGVTSFQDAGSSFDVIEKLAQMAESGQLKVRLWMMVREPNDVMRARLPEFSKLRRVGDNYLTLGGVKRSIDGALGPHGAWLLEDYADKPGWRGLNTATIEDVTEAALIALKYDLQMCVHAIGDRANREVLDIYEQIFERLPTRGGKRWRIEHAQHLSAADIPRFGELGVIASMQGIHCTSDAPWVLKRLGPERAEEGAYVWRKLMQSGAVISNGTDAPVEDVDPIASLYATVSRNLVDSGMFYPQQRMTRRQALESYTINAAYAAFEEDLKGTLMPGKLADIVVLSRDLMSGRLAEIPATKVDITIVGGRIAYERSR